MSIRGPLAAIGVPGPKMTAIGLDAEIVASSIPHHVIGDAARAIAAGARR